MNSVHEWDDVFLHFYPGDFLEILTKVVSQCCLRMGEGMGLYVFLRHSRGEPPQFVTIKSGL